MTKVTMDGRDYVLVPEQTYDDMVARLGAQLPPIPPPDERGHYPGKETVRALIARDLIRDRVAAGWTQQELARRAGVRIGIIQKLESGVHAPSIAALERIEAVLKKAGE